LRKDVAEEGNLGRFCHIAPGSASELQYHLILAHDLELIDVKTYNQLEKLVTEVERMLATASTASQPATIASG
jgi:four helix bundle protein